MCTSKWPGLCDPQPPLTGCWGTLSGQTWGAPQLSLQPAGWPWMGHHLLAFLFMEWEGHLSRRGRPSLPTGSALSPRTGHTPAPAAMSGRRVGQRLRDRCGWGVPCPRIPGPPLQYLHLKICVSEALGDNAIDHHVEEQEAIGIQAPSHLGHREQLPCNAIHAPVQPGVSPRQRPRAQAPALLGPPSGRPHSPVANSICDSCRKLPPVSEWPFKASPLSPASAQ